MHPYGTFIVTMTRTNSLSPIHIELLSPEGMARAREKAGKQNAWFFHASRITHFESIKKAGLQPRDPYSEEDDGVLGGG